MTPPTQPGSSAREPRTDAPLTDAERAYNRGWADGNASDACNPIIERLSAEVAEARAAGREEGRRERDAELLKHGQINVGTVVGYEAGLEEGRREGLALPDAETLAMWFHDTYESLAPEHGYETRLSSREEWDRVPEQNRTLMVATAAHVIRLIEEWRLTTGNGRTPPGLGTARLAPQGRDTGEAGE